MTTISDKMNTRIIIARHLANALADYGMTIYVPDLIEALTKSEFTLMDTDNGEQYRFIFTPFLLTIETSETDPEHQGRFYTFPLYPVTTDKYIIETGFNSSRDQLLFIAPDCNTYSFTKLLKQIDQMNGESIQELMKLAERSDLAELLTYIHAADQLSEFIEFIKEYKLFDGLREKTKSIGDYII